MVPYTNEQRWRLTSLVGLCMSAALAMTALLVGPTRRLFWSNLAVSCLVALGAHARARPHCARYVSWLMVLCGVWLVVSPSLLRDATPTFTTWIGIFIGFAVAAVYMFHLSRKSFRRRRRFQAGS
jgi:hypothetical protein